jgi:hypothetical protein
MKICIIDHKYGDTMKVTIKLIGVFQIGRFDEAVHDYPEGTSVRTLVEMLRLSTPLLGSVLINEIHAGVESLIHDGDTVCLLPFLDGG